jgi:elongation factor 1-gamma
LNDHLKDQTFLVGERVTLADIVVALHLLGLYTHVLDPGFRKAFVNTNRWFETVVNQPNWKEVLGEVVLCVKAAMPQKPVDAKPKEEKKPEPKKQPEAEKPKPKPKKTEEDEDEFVEAKPKSALDLLPKSSLDMDEWKRFYSNNDTKQAMAWFWEHLDKEGYSLWFSDYKYNDELESLLKTCNLIGGWYQRLDRMRKYGFANTIIFENVEKNHHEISNCWLVRGTTMPKEMTDCDDYELYEWSRVENPDDPEVRKKVEEYWSWEGTFGGRKFVQGKTFK